MRRRSQTVVVRDPDTGGKVHLKVRRIGPLVTPGLRNFSEPLFHSIAALRRERGEFSSRDIGRCAAAHHDIMMVLLGFTTRRKPSWLSELSELDGLKLMEAMWSVNCEFLTRGEVSSAASVSMLDAR